jgi:uncharacterized protein
MNVTIERDVSVAMSDGVRLSADVYRPAAAGSRPVIITRTPYLKETARFTARAEYFADHGYVYIIQDVRGRGKSQGDFYPFFAEGKDGFETLTWAASQPWSNGRLGTIGASYGAWTQWLTATIAHPNLVTMISEASPPDFFQCLPYQGGAFSLPLLSWLAELDYRRSGEANPIQWDSVLRGRPLRDVDRASGYEIRAWRDWLEHDRYDAYWDEIAFNRQMHRVTIPVFHVSGWYDDVLNGTLINYSALKTTSSTQKLLIGPWPHRLNTTSKFGEIDFGPKGLVDLFGVQREWFDRWLKDSVPGTSAKNEVNFFVMGANEWRRDVEWPPSNLEAQDYYLDSRGKSNSSRGDGKLVTRVPMGTQYDQFEYDPVNPVPFLTDPGWIQLGGPDDYRAVELREDVLVYTSDPLDCNLTVVGPIVVHLFAASSGVDTDFTARLIDVHPNGFAMRLNDGIVRAKFRSSYSHPTPIACDRIYEYRIDCWATAYEFPKGHSMRLEISSSAFPRYDPNLNSGLPINLDHNPIIARQRIFHGSRYPSRLVMPILRETS